MPPTDVPVVHMVDRLERFYGPLSTPPADPFRYLVWEVLASQTTPARREAAFAALQRIPALTPDSIARVPRAALMDAVALAGPYREQRLNALLLAVERFRREPDLGRTLRGPIRTARRAAARLPRLAEGAIHRLLLFGAGHAIVPIDRDVLRTWRRLRGQPSAGALTAGILRRARHDIEAALPGHASTFTRVALYVRHHAAQTCTDDPHCGVCPLADQCPSRRLFS